MKEQFNRLPRPTFKWMKVNALELDVTKTEKPGSAFMRERHEGDAAVQFYNGNQLPDLGDFEGANKEALRETLAPELVGQLDIDAGRDSELHLYTLFEGDAPHGLVNIFHYIQTGDHARVTVSKVQVQSSRVRHIDQRLTRDGAGSQVKFVSAEIGGREAVIHVKAQLDHDDSEFRSQSMYLGTGEQVVDYSYWVPTKGCRTFTDILTTGALMDRSKKYFRGTIDFLRGGKNRGSFC